MFAARHNKLKEVLLIFILIRIGRHYPMDLQHSTLRFLLKLNIVVDYGKSIFGQIQTVTILRYNEIGVSKLVFLHTKFCE